jgi:hypothetical protein
LAPGNLTLAVAMLLAVLLLVLHRQRDSEPLTGQSPLAMALLVALVLAAAIGVAGLLRGIVELTVAHERILAKLGRFVDGLAAIPIAAAAVLWGLRARAEADSVVTSAIPTSGTGPAPATFTAPTQQFGSPAPRYGPLPTAGSPPPPGNSMPPPPPPAPLP